MGLPSDLIQDYKKIPAALLLKPDGRSFSTARREDVWIKFKFMKKTQTAFSTQNTIEIIVEILLKTDSQELLQQAVEIDIEDLKQYRQISISNITEYIKKIFPPNYKDPNTSPVVYAPTRKDYTPLEDSIKQRLPSRLRILEAPIKIPQGVFEELKDFNKKIKKRRKKRLNKSIEVQENNQEAIISEPQAFIKKRAFGSIERGSLGDD